MTKKIGRNQPCPYHGGEEPQGERVYNEAQVVNAIFPSLSQVAKPDPF